MSTTTLVIRYAAFAVVAVIVNLAVQRLVLSGGTDPVRFALALVLGTLAGLVVKYLLDRRWIFRDTTRGALAQGRQFGLYTLMGVATTLIFWATETGFWLIWGTELAREIGAVLGLLAGYVTKYRLDRRFVFRQAAA